MSIGLTQPDSDSGVNRLEQTGVIGRVHVQLMLGAVTPEAARALVAGAYADQPPAADEVEAVASAAPHMTEHAEFRVNDLAVLLEEAVRSLPATDPRRITARALTADVALGSLMHFPDGRLYRTAVEAADSVLHQARSGTGPDLSKALHRSARVRVVSYLGSYRTPSWWQEPLQWTADADRVLGPGDHADATMPPALPEIAEGLRLLDELAGLTTGLQQAVALYELAAAEQVVALDGNSADGRAAVQHAEAAWVAAGSELPADLAVSISHLLARAGAALADKLPRIASLVDQTGVNLGNGATNSTGFLLNALETALLARDPALSARIAEKLVSCSATS